MTQVIKELIINPNKPNTRENVPNSNTKPFISTVVNHVTDLNQGIPQHKTTMWKHLTHQRLPGEAFYEPFIEQISNRQLVKYEPHTLVDFRTANELAILKEYIDIFGKDLVWTYSTLDARSANFPKAQQTNPDFWVMIDRTLGLGTTRCTYQDEKSGMDILRHTTRGSVGMLCFDENGNNIQMTSESITTHDLIVSYKRKLRNIEAGLKQDGLWPDENNPFAKTLDDADKIIKKMEGKLFIEIQDFHNELQNLLWKELQCNPNYNRSVSFIFIKQLINSPLTDKETIFSEAFKSKLKPDYLYNFDRKSDLQELYSAFIYAGRKIHPYFIDKLYHLHSNGISLTKDVILILKEITKNAIH